MLREKEKLIDLPTDPDVSTAILKDIATDVIKCAVRDMKGKQYELQLDAFYFLSGPDLPVWLAAVYGDDPEELQDAGLSALSSGRIGELKRIG